jgi:predicted permease
VHARLVTGGLGPGREQDIVDELAGQLDEAYREAIGRGLSEADAEAVALAHVPDWTSLSKQVIASKRLADGTLDRVERQMLDAGAAGSAPAGFLGSLIQDVRYALRMAGRAPFFTAVAVLTLALGIGANATIFSWINAFLLDPLPGADGRGLVDVREQSKNGRVTAMSYPDFMDLRASTPAAKDLFVHDIQAGSLAHASGAERIWIELVSDNFFDALRVSMAAGRGFEPHEGREPIPVVVIAERLARARFGTAADAVDKSVVINHIPFTVVGVTTERFASGYSGLVMDAWLPIQMSPTIVPGASRVAMRNNGWLDSIARIDPSMPLEQASVQLTEARNRLARDHGVAGDSVMTVTPFWRSQSGAQSVLSPVLLVLMGTVTIVLLIACANIANLLLSRAAARSREFALRLSLGCGRGRLIRQLLTESLVLVFFAAIAAAVIQVWTGGVLLQLLPPNNMPVGLTTPLLNGRVLAFTAAVAFLSAVIFGLAPAWQAGRTDLVTNLKVDTSRLAGGRRSWLRNALVVSQMAFALLLLTSAGLFIRSLGQAKTFDVGFQADGVLIASLDLFSAGYDRQRGTELLAQVLDDVRALPGVEAASLSRRVPLGISTGSSSSTIEVEGYVPPKDDDVMGFFGWVAADYFRVMQIPVLAGREFSSADRADLPETVLVNRAFVDRYWPGQNAIGRRVRIGGDWLTVSGVVGNSKHRRLTERAEPFVYFSTAWRFRPDVVLHLKAQGDPERFAEPLRAIVRRADPTLPLFNVMKLNDHVKAASFQQQVSASLLSVFGALALLLASIGLYASMAYSVSRRTREMGARLALGAAPKDITRLVLGHAARLISIGVAIGLGLAFVAAQLMSSLLFGIQPLDLATFVGVTVVLTVIAMTASYLPARRAAHLDPLQALRQE